jgi:hypothetical protein
VTTPGKLHTDINCGPARAPPVQLAVRMQSGLWTQPKKKQEQHVAHVEIHIKEAMEECSDRYLTLSDVDRLT